jgi:protein-S-isoprenylcysteine O-methyltransferase Ste14
MSRRTTGWVLVVIQVVLFVALAVTSGQGRSDWPTPPIVRGLAALCTLIGLVVVAVASLQLGRALTATPLPNGRGALRTGGLFGVVRHPLYSGVMLVVIGLAARSASWISAVLAVLTVAFFHGKARWEEQRLNEAFDGYATYAAVTPRFVPRPNAQNM